MAEKIYCGSAKARETQYGEQLTVSLDISEFHNYFKEYGYIAKSGKHMITLKINKRREPGKYGETHSVEVDTWKPGTTPPPKPASKSAPPPDFDVPFDGQF